MYMVLKPVIALKKNFFMNHIPIIIIICTYVCRMYRYTNLCTFADDIHIKRDGRRALPDPGID